MVIASVVATDACAWPVIVRLRADTLGLVSFNRPSHGEEEGDLEARISRDDGKTWEPAGLAAPRPVGGNRMHIASGVDRSGRWIVLSSGFQIRDGKYAGLDPVWCSVADTPGGIWRVTRDLRIDGVPSRVIPHGRILALDDGRLLATVYLSGGRGHPSRAWLITSSDGGGAWLAASEIGSGDVNEVVLFRAPGTSRLLAAARTHVDHHIDLFASDDAGTNWMPRAMLTLPMQHPGDLSDLGENRVLLTYGIRNRGLMGIGARLSKDGGVSWGAPALIGQFGDATDCGYPSTIVCNDGALLTACYSDLSPWHRGYHLLTARWRLEDFFQTKPLRSLSDGRPLEA